MRLVQISDLIMNRGGRREEWRHIDQGEAAGWTPVGCLWPAGCAGSGDVSHGGPSSLNTTTRCIGGWNRRWCSVVSARAATAARCCQEGGGVCAVVANKGRRMEEEEGMRRLSRLGDPSSSSFAHGHPRTCSSAPGLDF